MENNSKQIDRLVDFLEIVLPEYDVSLDKLEKLFRKRELKEGRCGEYFVSRLTGVPLWEKRNQEATDLINGVSVKLRIATLLSNGIGKTAAYKADFDYNPEHVINEAYGLTGIAYINWFPVTDKMTYAFISRDDLLQCPNKNGYIKVRQDHGGNFTSEWIANFASTDREVLLGAGVPTTYGALLV